MAETKPEGATAVNEEARQRKIEEILARSKEEGEQKQTTSGE